MRMVDESVLDSALTCHRLGWSIIPIKAGTKGPGCKWMKYQIERPSELQLRKWFARGGERGLAVILGDVSGGLVCRDFDTMPSYQHWASKHRDLAGSLPTVVTSRGRHVYFRSSHRGIRKYGDGELRGAGYCVLPPSRHPTGSRYQWVTPPPAEPLPEVDVVAAGLLLPERYVTESTEKTERTEEYRCHRGVEGVSGGQGFLAPSTAPLTTLFDELPTVVQSAIIGSLPTGPGRRNEQVFELARALKAVPFLSDADGRELRPYVLHWHALALPVITTQPFEETWIDLLRGWKNVKFPKGAEPMLQIAERALTLEPPPVAARYEQPALRKLVSLCRELQQTAGEGPFYLACRTAGRLLAVDHMTAWRWLFLLVSDGILIEVQKGGPRTGKASRYRYTGLAN